MEFYISATTDVGTKKNINQDSLFVRKMATKIGKMVFAVLCDGMGGLKKGEIASASLISAFTDWMYKCLPELSQKPLEDGIIKDQWFAVITKQNDKIRAYGQQKNCLMGSTITALLLKESRFFLLNIGDSRAYELSGKARQLTTDHTVVAEEVTKGNLTAEQAENAPMINVLTRCVGVSETIYPDMFFGDTKKNVIYMLCSDGFRHQISPEEAMEHLCSTNGTYDAEMKLREEYLIELNKQRGETDNISVITIATK